MPCCEEVASGGSEACDPPGVFVRFFLNMLLGGVFLVATYLAVSVSGFFWLLAVSASFVLVFVGLSSFLHDECSLFYFSLDFLNKPEFSLGSWDDLRFIFWGMMVFGYVGLCYPKRVFKSYGCEML